MKLILNFMSNVRWAYFHLHPSYEKFYLTDKEAMFYNHKSNTIHVNYSVK